MSEKPASNIGILRISAKNITNVTAYKLTEDDDILYAQKLIKLRRIAGLSE